MVVTGLLFLISNIVSSVLGIVISVKYLDNHPVTSGLAVHQLCSIRNLLSGSDGRYLQ